MRTVAERWTEYKQINIEHDAHWLYDHDGVPYGVVVNVLKDGTVEVNPLGSTSSLDNVKFRADQVQRINTGHGCQDRLIKGAKPTWQQRAEAEIM